MAYLQSVVASEYHAPFLALPSPPKEKWSLGVCDSLLDRRATNTLREEEDESP